MKRTPILPDYQHFPSRFHSLMKDAAIFDSSCSTEARVYFIQKDIGFFLKNAPKGTLERESKMTSFFHQKGLGPQLIDYYSRQQDWILTARIPGEDCIHPIYMENPERLCDTTAELLWNLHQSDPSGCPVPDHTKDYLLRTKEHYISGSYDKSAFPDSFGFSSAQEAWQVIERDSRYLQSDTLIHGDYCLPNIMLDNWHFSGFIDLDWAGVGDRHVDLFWGCWTLFFNFKTNKYYNRFLDAYGRDAVEPDLLRLVAACEVFG